MTQQIPCGVRTKKKFNQHFQEALFLHNKVSGPALKSLNIPNGHSVSVLMFSEQALICSIMMFILEGINNRLDEEKIKEESCLQWEPNSRKHHSKFRRKASISSSKQCELSNTFP